MSDLVRRREAEEAHARNVTAYYAAMRDLAKSTEELLRAETLAAFPTATQIVVTGSYSEDGLMACQAVRVLDAAGTILGDYDDHISDEWDVFVENANDALMWLATTGDEDWLNENTIDLVNEVKRDLVAAGWCPMTGCGNRLPCKTHPNSERNIT